MKPETLSKEDKRRILAEESAILSFTEEVLRRMEEIGMSKSELAANLTVEPAAVSKLISGSNNFTLRTMVKIARALGSRLKFSLPAMKTKGAWAVAVSPQFSVQSEHKPASRNASSYTYQAISIYDAAVTVPRA